MKPVVVVPLPYPHTLISMVLTVLAASSCLRRTSALTSDEPSDPAQDQGKGQNNNKGQGKRTTATTATTTAAAAAAAASDLSSGALLALALAPPLISDRPLPPLLLLLADLTRAVFRHEAL